MTVWLGANICITTVHQSWPGLQQSPRAVLPPPNYRPIDSLFSQFLYPENRGGWLQEIDNVPDNGRLRDECINLNIGKLWTCGRCPRHPSVISFLVLRIVLIIGSASDWLRPHFVTQSAASVQFLCPDWDLSEPQLKHRRTRGGVPRVPRVPWPPFVFFT